MIASLFSSAVAARLSRGSKRWSVCSVGATRRFQSRNDGFFAGSGYSPRPGGSRAPFHYARTWSRRIHRQRQNCATESKRSNNEHDAVAKRHAEFCRDFVGEAQRLSLVGPAAAADEALDVIVSNMYDLHSAIDWTLEKRKDAVLGLEIVGALFGVWSASAVNDRD